MDLISGGKVSSADTLGSFRDRNDSAELCDEPRLQRVGRELERACGAFGTCVLTVVSGAMAPLGRQRAELVERGSEAVHREAQAVDCRAAVAHGFYSVPGGFDATGQNLRPGALLVWVGSRACRIFGPAPPFEGDTPMGAYQFAEGAYLTDVAITRRANLAACDAAPIEMQGASEIYLRLDFVGGVALSDWLLPAREAMRVSHQARRRLSHSACSQILATRHPCCLSCLLTSASRRRFRATFAVQ